MRCAEAYMANERQYLVRADGARVAAGAFGFLTLIQVLDGKKP
jgi:hypothetical protein